MPKEPLKPLSEAIFGPVTRAYKAGGFGLAFLALGAFLMLAAFFLPAGGVSGGVVAGTGFMLILLVCLLFLMKDVLPLFRAQRRIRENRDLIDAVQAIALQMTDVASDLQSLAFKHASDVSEVMREARPLLRRVPLIGTFADSELITRADDLSSAIVEYTGSAKKIITDVEHALVSSDARLLKKYAAELDTLRAGVTKLLKT